MPIPEDVKKQLKGIKGMAELEAEYKKRMKGAGRGKRMKGGSFWDDMWKAIQATAGDVNNFIKDNKIISKGSEIAKYVLPAVGLAGAVPLAAKVGEIAKSKGYGRKVKGGRVVGRPLSAGTTAQKPPKMYKAKMSSKQTLSQNGQFQDTPVMVGKGMVGGRSMEISPTAYNMVSTNKNMKIKV